MLDKQVDVFIKVLIKVHRGKGKAVVLDQAKFYR